MTELETKALKDHVAAGIEEGMKRRPTETMAMFILAVIIGALFYTSHMAAIRQSHLAELQDQHTHERFAQLAQYCFDPNVRVRISGSSQTFRFGETGAVP